MLVEVTHGVLIATHFDIIFFLIRIYLVDNVNQMEHFGISRKNLSTFGGCWDALGIYLPNTYSWHALYRFPLAAVMALGIDIPCTSVINSGIVVAGITVMPFRQQLQTNDKETE